MPHLFKRKTFNDTLALSLMVLIIALWTLDGLNAAGVKNPLDLPGEVIGATIAIAVKVTDFYFRKAPPTGT